MTNYLDKSIVEINKLLKSKTIKPIDLVNEAFDKIKDHDDLFITLCRESAIDKAKSLEDKDVDNLLFGIPIVLSDNIVTKGIKTTCGSKMLSNFIPIYDSFVVDLINKNNLIIIGKSNMKEFCNSSSLGYIVGNNITPLGLGTDVLGLLKEGCNDNKSICFIPTYGRVSRYGIITACSSMEQVGTITNNVYDCALLLNLLCKKDEHDLNNVSTSEDFTSYVGSSIKNMNVLLNGSNEKIVSFFKSNDINVSISDISSKEISIIYNIIYYGELSTNLARYDGIKYGYSTENPKNIHELYRKTRSEGFSFDTKVKIMAGSYLVSPSKVNDYYKKALKIRNSINNKFNDLFNKYDVIVGTFDKSFILVANLIGLPSICINGLYIIGKRFDEKSVLKLASFIYDKGVMFYE